MKREKKSRRERQRECVCVRREEKRKKEKEQVGGTEEQDGEERKTGVPSLGSQTQASAVP